MCNVLNMKRILFFLIMQTSLFPLMADDGGVTNVEDWTYGNIYVKEPNDKIALEKELMVCDMDSITAVFVFKNTTEDTVTVDCAFPMDVKLPYTCGNKMDGDPYLRYYSFRVLRWLLGPKDTLNPVEVIGEDGMIALNDRVCELVSRHDKELRVMDLGHYCQYMESLLREDYAPFYPLCEITQDGKPVTLLNVGVESDVSSQDIAMRFHFHHQLTFLPNVYSKVVVRYGIESLKESYNDIYRYCYDISTGGTWKGNIHSFMVVTRNCSMESFSSNPVNRHFDYLCCDEMEECGIYSKKEYKPEKGDRFSFEYYDAILYEHDQYPAPKYEKLRCVPLKDVESSSWLNPSAVMDGSQFTSCAIVDWRNASLEFTLPQDALGPFICNGMSGNLVSEKDLYAFEKSFSGLGGSAGTWLDANDYMYEDEPFKSDSSIYDNNWVRNISLQRLEEPFDTFFYYVEKCDMRKFPLLFDWRRISGVPDMSYFPAGRYRLSIEDCHLGQKDQDTTYVTELWFLPIPREMSEMMSEDRKSQLPIFQDVVDYARGKGIFRDDMLYGGGAQGDVETHGNVSGPYEKPELFGNKKFHRTYTNPLEQDEKETNFPLLYVVIGAFAALALIGGIVYWRRKRR